MYAVSEFNCSGIICYTIVMSICIDLAGWKFTITSVKSIDIIPRWCVKEC